MTKLPIVVGEMVPWVKCLAVIIRTSVLIPRNMGSQILERTYAVPVLHNKMASRQENPQKMAD